MSTVIFDFDSTLVDCETLDLMLVENVSTSDARAQIRRLTDEGMEGRSSFSASLAGRLRIAAPSYAQVAAFGRRAVERTTPGMADLINRMRRSGVRVRIVSGGLFEVIEPVARALGISADHVHAVRLLWTADGAFAGVDPHDPFSVSKSQGIREIARQWSRPIVAVGDGMTDLQLQRDGIADAFVAYTEHVRREAIARAGVPEARSAAELESLLHTMGIDCG